MSDCLFCRIIRGEIPSDSVHQDDLVVAFRDIHPRARVHVLIVPREHVPSLADLGSGHNELVTRLIAVANQLAKQEGITESGFRLLTNAGPDAGQVVDHLHLHLLGGERLAGFGAR